MGHGRETVVSKVQGHLGPVRRPCELRIGKLDRGCAILSLRDHEHHEAQGQVPRLAFALACARNRASCARSSGVAAGPKSFISNT